MKPGERVGPYVLDSLLGRGGFGEVWRARDGKLNRWVALKLLTLDDPDDRRRFLRAGAVEEYDACLRLDPGIFEAVSNRALTLMDLGRPDEAIAAFDRALATWPGNATLIFNRGLAHHVKGDLARALADYDEAAARGCRVPELFGNRGTLWAQKRDFPRALADLDEAVRLAPDHVNHFNRANTRYDAGDRKGAAADYARALEIAPPDWPDRAKARRGLDAARRPK